MKSKLKPLIGLANDCKEGDLILIRNLRRERGLPVYIGWVGKDEIYLYLDEIWTSAIVFDRKTNEVMAPPYNKRGYTHYEVLKRKIERSELK